MRTLLTWAIRARICLLSRHSGLRRVAARQVAEETADTVDRFEDVLHAVGVGKPQIPFAERAEAGAGDRRDADLFEQFALQAACVVAGLRNVWERVEGAAGIGAAYAWEGVEGGNDCGAALGEGG